MTGALAYLFWTTSRNRLLTQLRRVRNPRYAVAFAVGALYFWWLLIRPAALPVRGARVLFGTTSAALAPLLLVVLLSGVWLFGGDRTALAFPPAEVALLFTAPITRRSLIVYKLVRAQLSIVLSSIIWVFLLRRGSATLPGILSALGFWVLFMTLAFHRLGAALVRASSQEHGVVGLRRNRASIALFATIVVVLLMQLFGARQSLLGAHDAGVTMRVLATAFSTLPARVVLFPFSLMLGPTYAASAGEWTRAMPPALAILGLHAWWVLQSNVRFEEAAVEASALRARQLERARARFGAAPVVVPSSGARTIALAATGRPAMAVVWKNMICLLRTSQLRQLLGPAMIVFVVPFAFAGGEGDAFQNLAVIAILLALVLLLFGGRSIRNDLRSDMLYLPLLKALPLSAPDIVLAEVASGAVPMAAVQLVLLAVAAVALALSRSAFHIPLEFRIGALVAAPAMLLALNVAMFTILNGTAVLFPGWIRLGTKGAAGIEALGANMIATFGTLLLLVLLLVVPIAVGIGVYAGIHAHPGAASALSGTAAAVVLGMEDYFLLGIIGRAFARAEPTEFSGVES